MGFYQNLEDRLCQLKEIINLLIRIGGLGGLGVGSLVRYQRLEVHKK